MTKFAHAPARSTTSFCSWCGPYALAAVAGIDYDAAYDTCLQVTGKPVVKGLTVYHLQKGLAARGVQYTRLPLRDTRKPAEAPFLGEPMTLTQWYKQRPDKQATYVVNVTGHYVVVRGTRVIDNQQPKWQPFADRKKHKRSLVKNVIQIA
jgi:hypothetical protein